MEEEKCKDFLRMCPKKGDPVVGKDKGRGDASAMLRERGIGDKVSVTGTRSVQGETREEKAHLSRRIGKGAEHPS